MSPNVDFGILVVILLLIGNEVTSVKRKVNEIKGRLDAILKRLDQSKLNAVEDKLDTVLKKLNESR